MRHGSRRRHRVSTFPIAVPLGFRTDFTWGEDAKDEAENLVTGAGSVAESDPSPTMPKTGTNSSTALSTSGRVLRVNDQRGRLFAGARGAASFVSGTSNIKINGSTEDFKRQPETSHSTQPEPLRTSPSLLRKRLMSCESDHR